MLSIACAAWLAACGAAPPAPPMDSGPRSQAVHVVSNGWHTAIVVPHAEVAATGLVPEAAQFPDAAFLEFGWGDREYYQAAEATLGMTLRAALTPTPAVMHLAGRARVPEPREGREVVRAMLTEAGFRRMLRAIGAKFERPEEGPAEPVAPGLYPESRFYDARGSFHLFNTCNTWTARMLRAGGVAVSPAGVVTAGQAMARLRAAVGADEASGGRFR